MARKNGRNNRLPPFVAVSWDILNSKAYIDLPHATAKALPYFLGKPKLPFNDRAYYETDFDFSYSEGKRLGFAYSTFAKVLEELILKGFVDPVDKGGLRGHGKARSKFQLSKRWQKYGDDGFPLVSWKGFHPKR